MVGKCSFDNFPNVFKVSEYVAKVSHKFERETLERVSWLKKIPRIEKKMSLIPTRNISFFYVENLQKNIFF